MKWMEYLKEHNLNGFYRQHRKYIDYFYHKEISFFNCKMTQITMTVNDLMPEDLFVRLIKFFKESKEYSAKITWCG